MRVDVSIQYFQHQKMNIEMQWDVNKEKNSTLN